MNEKQSETTWGPLSTMTAAVNTSQSVNDRLYLDLLKKCLTGYLYPESSNVEIFPHRGMRMARKALVKALNKRGFKLFKTMPFDPDARSRGTDWPCIGYSMVGCKRLDNLQACVESVLEDGVPGDLIETGVWRGGACILMRAILKMREVGDRNVWLADSFEGLPSPSLEADRGYDLSENSYTKASLEQVQEAFQRFGLLDAQVKFLKGWFKDTLPNAPIGQLAVLRTDGDLYESTMDVLRSLYHKVSVRGFVIVDDYHDWPPCRRAVDEFRARNNVLDPIQEIDGKGVFWRKSS
ncbi:MAG: TylF/MycF family methyltransferase [Candidatus Sulfotelmatobacter sp.]